METNELIISRHNRLCLSVRSIAHNGWVFVSVLPCTNVQIKQEAQRQNSTNTVLAAVASTALDTKHKKNELKILKRGN